MTKPFNPRTMCHQCHGREFYEGPYTNVQCCNCGAVYTHNPISDLERVKGADYRIVAKEDTAP